MTLPHSTLNHDHAEVWAMRSGLDDTDVRFARMVLPITRELKTRLVGLGGVALQPPASGNPGVQETASRLADRVTSWLNSAQDEEVTDHSRLLIAGLTELREWARVAATHGLSGEVASGLSRAYRHIRQATDIAWHSELVPEGRTLGPKEICHHG